MANHIRSLNQELTTSWQVTPRILKERADELYALMDSAPSLALSLTLSDDEIRRLKITVPSQLEDLETPDEWQGRSIAIVEDNFQDGTSRTRWRLHTINETLDLRFTGEEPATTCEHELKVKGVRLRDRVIASTFTATPSVTPASSTPCSTLGVQQIAVLLVSFPHSPLPSATSATVIQDIFFGPGLSVNGYWNEVSYGMTSASGSVFGPFALDADYTCDQFDAIVSAAIQKADTAVDLTKYSRIVIVFPQYCGYAGSGSTGCSTQNSPSRGPFKASIVWLPVFSNQPLAGGGAVSDPNGNYGLAAHELGHNFGMSHANSLDFGALALGPIGAPGISVEQGDPFSVMGNAGRDGHFNAQEKLQLGWIDSSNVRTVQSSGTFTIDSLETASTGLKAIRVQRGLANNLWLWVEYRQPGSQYEQFPDPEVFSGALIHYEDPGDKAHPLYTQLLDFTPTKTPNNFLRPALPAGTTWSDPYSSLRLTIGKASGNGIAVTVTYAPSLTITKMHSGNFVQGQQNASYNITVANASGVAPTSGSITVTETPPSGLTLVSMSGVGWTCNSNICTRADALNGGSSYPSITVTVNVASDAGSPQVNQATVSGGGSSPSAAADMTMIMPVQEMPITASPPGVTLEYAVGSPEPVPAMLAVSTASAVSFSVTTPPGAIWLKVNPTSGQTPANLAVTIDPSGLPVGSYHASITITSTAAGVTPLTVPVTVNILPSADGLQFGQAVSKSVSTGVPVALALSILDLYVLTNSIEIYQNNPTAQAPVNLTAQPLVALPSGSDPTALLALDLNGDHFADLVVLDNSGVTTYLGRGSGYSAAQSLAANTNPVAMSMLNLTGNANSGLAVIGDDGVALFTANGDGTFTPATTFDVTGHQGKLLAVAAGSFTGSGLDDIVLSDAGGNIWLLPSDGAGGFGNPTMAQAGAVPSALAVGDFNGDGNLDLATANSGSSSVSLLLGDGAGDLGRAATFNISGPLGPLALVAADFNRDGKLDLAVAVSGNNSVCLLRGDGAGGFGTPLQYLVGTTPVALAIGDIDSDGRPDIVIANRQSRDLSILLNQN